MMYSFKPYCHKSRIERRFDASTASANRIGGIRSYASGMRRGPNFPSEDFGIQSFATKDCRGESYINGGYSNASGVMRS
jgi:hypothetical protein